MTLFPNPTNGLVYLDLGQMYNEVAVRVLDIAGRAVWQSEFDAISQSEFRLDVVSGVYFVQVSSIKGAAIFKLVVNR